MMNMGCGGMVITKEMSAWTTMPKDTTDPPEEQAQRLRECAHRLEFTRNAIAAAAHVKWRTVDRWWRGMSDPRGETLTKIERAIRKLMRKKEDAQAKSEPERQRSGS